MHRQAIVWVLLAAAGMAGCAASQPQPAGLAGEWAVPPVQSELDMDAALPLSDAGRDRLFRGAVRADGAAGLVDYDAQYALLPGDILRSMQAGGDSLRAAPTEVGAQTLQQQIRAALPLPLGAPVRVGFETSQRSSLTVHGERESRSAGAGLQWAPGPLDLSLQWSAPRETVVAGDPLDCTMRSSLRLPVDLLAAGSTSAVDVSQRECRVVAPGRGMGFGDLGVRSWGAAWQWGDDARNALRVQRIALEPRDTVLPAQSPDYELGLSHRRLLLDGWRAEADVAVRRISDDLPGEEGAEVDVRWSADLALRRELDMIILTARWAHARDPLWFAPMAAPVGRERVSLGLDFNPWLAGVWPRADTAMVASWERTQGEAGIGYNRLNWSFSMFW